VQGNPFDEESPASDEFDMEMDPELHSPPGAKAKEKLKSVITTIKVSATLWYLIRHKQCRHTCCRGTAAGSLPLKWHTVLAAYTMNVRL
jgi:hypothetical protein